MTKEQWLRKFSYIMMTKIDEQNITAYELSRRAGCSDGTFYAYINGESAPNAYTLQKIAKGIGCTTDELVMFDDDAEEAYDRYKRKIVEVPRDIQNNIHTDYWKKLFSQNLTNKMYEKNMNQKELSIKTGINPVCILRYLEGDVVPNAWRLLNIAKVLECSVDDLVDFGSMVVD